MWSCQMARPLSYHTFLLLPSTHYSSLSKPFLIQPIHCLVPASIVCLLACFAVSASSIVFTHSKHQNNAAIQGGLASSHHALSKILYTSSLAQDSCLLRCYPPQSCLVLFCALRYLKVYYLYYSIQTANSSTLYSLATCTSKVSCYPTASYTNTNSHSYHADSDA